MMKGIGKQKIGKLAALALVACMILSCVGCGKSQVASSQSPDISLKDTESVGLETEGASLGSEGDSSDVYLETESEEALPGFLAASVASEGTENLSELHADFLVEGNYDTVMLYGENLLFVRMYVEEDAEAIEDYEYDENFVYSFAVYSPQENTVLATYDSKDDPIDYYQVAGDRLLLIDYADYEIRIYDELLSPEGTYDASSFLGDSDGTFYAGSDENSYYFMSYADYGLKMVSFTDGETVVQDCDTGFYCSYIAGVSASGSKLVLQTVNAETFFNELLIVNAADLSVDKTYAHTSAYFPTLSDSAFLTGTDYTNGIYLYENFETGAKYFSVADLLSVEMLGDYILVVQDELYEDYDENGEPIESDTYYTLCAYNESGSCVSGCSYISYGNIYVVSEPVYLEAYDCCVVLMVDYGESEEEEIEPFLLIWDMAEESEIPDETRGDVPEYLLMCESEEVALASKNSSSMGDGEDSNTEGSSGADGTEGGEGSDSESGNNGESGDTESSSSGEDETETEDDSDGYIYGDTVTLVTDPESYDWGDLAEARQKADALAEQYGVEIYLGPEIPTYISEYQTEQCLDAETVSAALDQLEMILEIYPESLYPQLLYGDLQGIRIYLTGSIWGQDTYLVSQATAFVDEINDYAVLVADAWQYWDWNYTVNHEISHLIDRSLEFRSRYKTDCLYSEETWSSYNPESFEYAYTYEDFSSLPWYDYMEYFVDEYGMTYATEDRAQLFGASVSNYIDSDTYFWVFTEDSPLVQKLVYYCECIREDFNSEGWDEVLPWEAAVEEYIE